MGMAQSSSAFSSSSSAASTSVSNTTTTTINERRLRAIFNRADTSHSGGLSREEMVAMLLNKTGVTLPTAKVTEVMARCGCSETQEVDFDQFKRMVMERDRMITDMFEAIDTNGDGRLQREEVKQEMARQLHIELSEHDIDLMFRGSHQRDALTLNELRDILCVHGIAATTPSDMIRSWLRLPATNYHLYTDSPTASFASQLSLDTLICGFVAGGVSRTLTAPMDRLSLVMRAGGTVHAKSGGGSVLGTMRSMVKSGGVASLWRGNGVNVMQVGPESAMTFFLYNQLKLLISADPAHPTGGEKFACGASAGAMAMTLVYPLYVLQARMAVAEPGQFRGLWHLTQQTVKLEGGVRALFHGYIPSFIRVNPYKGIDMLVFNTLKERVLQPEEAPSVPQSIAFGSVASSISQTLTYPLVFARTRIQSQGKAFNRPRLYSGMLDVWKKTVYGDMDLALPALGARGLFQGYVPNMLKSVPACAIQFAVFEFVMKQMQERAALLEKDIIDGL
jgi:solute carrier family 25 phosphate transporter 23/24/25/41